MEIQLAEMRTGLITTADERDEFKKLYKLSRKATSEQFDLRQEAEAKVLKLEQELEAAEKARDHNAELAEKLRSERDEARQAAMDLAQKSENLIEQLKELQAEVESKFPQTQGWNGKVAARDSKGRFKPKASAVIPAGTLKEGDTLYIQMAGRVQRPVKHLREVNEEQAKQVQPTEGERPDDSHVGEQQQPADMPPIEPRPDHPCLKGCSKPDGCFCPPGLPRYGSVQFVHPRSFFVEKGILEGDEHAAGDYKKLEEWADSVGAYCQTLTSHNRYIFTRPAVNSDFDVPNTTQP